MRVERWPRGYKIVVEGRKTDRRVTKRGQVSEFSDNSRRNLSWAYNQGPWVGMLTLTYPKNELLSKEETKRHLKNFSQVLKRAGIGYLWILEFQRRGIPHFHVWVNRSLTERTDSVTGDKIRRHFPWRSLMLSWLRIIGESENDKAKRVALHPTSYTPWEVRVGNNYAAKYADKRCQKGLPESVQGYGRWWGQSRGLNKPLEVRHYDEGPTATTCRRQLQRLMVRWWPRLERAYMSPNQGVRRALQEKKLVDFSRILMYYMGTDDDPLPIIRATRPDTWSYSFRVIQSQHRFFQRGENV